MNPQMRKAGFTLIELMIVIAIIAIIAAIAIPGLIASQRAANERNASASLKTVTAAQVDFRSNDRDGNHILDYWTRDVSGLYSLCPIGGIEPIKLIEISLLAADSDPQGTATAPASAEEVAASTYAVQAPKAMFWYLALDTDDLGDPYRVNTRGIPPHDMNAWFHTTKFAILAYPESFTAGRSMFYVNETNTIFKRSLIGSVRPTGGTSPPGSVLVTSGAVGTSPLVQWPTNTQLRVDYSRLD